MNNRDYFNYSKSNPEEMFDPYYTKSVLVIPEDISKSNELTRANGRLIDLITTFQVLKSQGKTKNDSVIQDVVNEIIEILNKGNNINYSAFCQFFMVYNQTYSGYCSLNPTDKKEFIYTMLEKYCLERHYIYQSHGYTNSILQVMCDNYSHKRKGKAGIDKYVDMLSKYITYRIEDENEIIDEDDYYFLPDKGDDDLFECMLSTLDLEMKSRENEQNKLPDLVFKHNNNYYIIELKTMKGAGGGQNKQAVEFVQFINFSEKENNIHYITILDAEYSNTLFESEQPKIVNQRNDIITALNNNRGNYFLNTKGTEKFLEDLFKVGE